jgi:sec-independent protein translocase protein TatB
MFDIAPTEFLAVAVVALVVIGPKDLPKAMRVLGYWVGKARGAARQFRSGFDNMVREAELAEMEKRWAEENERIMREHGAGGQAEASASADLATTGEVAQGSDDAQHRWKGDGGSEVAPAASSDGVAQEPDLFSQPVTVEHPSVEPAAAPPAADAKANS